MSARVRYAQVVGQVGSHEVKVHREILLREDLGEIIMRKPYGHAPILMQNLHASNQNLNFTAEQARELGALLFAAADAAEKGNFDGKPEGDVPDDTLPQPEKSDVR